MAAGCLAATTVLLSVFFCAAFIYKKQIPETEALVRIGVCVDEEDEMFTRLINFAGRTSSLKNICSLELFEENEARSRLKNGELDMIMVVPPDFVSKADTMQDTSFTVYVPKDSSGNIDGILSLFKSVEGTMTYTEDAILSMYDGMSAYNINVTTSDMENEVTGMFVDSFLQRRNSIDLKYISAFGDYDFIQYYVCTIILTMILIYSFAFLRTYDRSHREIERILFRDLCGKVMCHIGKIMSVSIPLWMVMSVIILAMDRMCLMLGSSLVIADVRAYLMIIPVCLGIGIVIHIAGCILKGNDNFFMGYAGVVILLITVSGLIFPESCMPAALRCIANISPVFWWHKLLLMALF